MSRNADDARARAEARFNREQQRSRQDEALKAKIAAEGRAVDKKTVRLKELRLAKEGAEREAAARAQVPSRKRAIKVKDLTSENDG
jgi:hypothetical protein